MSFTLLMNFAYRIVSLFLSTSKSHIMHIEARKIRISMIGTQMNVFHASRLPVSYDCPYRGGKAVVL